MDHRTDSFVRKFKSAQLLLASGSIQDIVSLKYRDNCVNDSEYAHFIEDYLKRSLGLDVKPASGDFWGKAWVVSDNQGNKILLVEHETGLEILYIAGAIASLIALIPLVSSGWNWFRDGGFHTRFHRPDRQAIEVRRLNTENTVVEQQVQSMEVFVLNAGVEEIAGLRERVRLLEEEVATLKQGKRLKNKPVRPHVQKKKRNE